MEDTSIIWKASDNVIVNPKLVALLQEAKLRVTKLNDNPKDETLLNVRIEVMGGILNGGKYMIKCQQAKELKVGDVIKVKITDTKPYANTTTNNGRSFTWLNPSFTGKVVKNFNGDNRNDR